MKIVITATAPELSAQVDERFGRAAYFIVADTEKDGFQAIANDNIDASSGAGVASAKKVVEFNPAAVLTGNCGPKAEQTLAAAKIKIITGISGTVADAIKTAKEKL
jgi:predicted Fe-Mo cluster-binding NifX family protein